MKKTNYFSSILFAAGMFATTFVFGQNSCDTLRNYIVPGDNTYTTWTSSGGGLLLGQDELTSGSDSYQTDVWAESYNVGTSSTEIRAIRMLPHTIQDNSGSASLTIQVYDEISGEPGNVIGSQSVDYSDLRDEMVWSLVEFNTPVSVTGKFYVGYEVSFATPVDSFALATTQPTTNYSMFHLTGPGTLDDEWIEVSDVYTAGGAPINSAFAFDVLTSTGTVPDPNFTGGLDEICESGSFSGLDASSTTGDVDVYEWWLADDPLTEVYTEDTGINGTLNPTTSSPSNQAIYLWADGACVSRGVYSLVTVNPDVSATINAIDETCGEGNGEINITNPSGGDGNYLYSIDGGTNTGPSSTFSNLSDGSYNVEVSTDGSGCVYSETVTITNTPGETISVGSGATICEGESATITASGNGTIEWFDGATSLGTGTSMTVSPTASGIKTYDAVLTDGNGCTDTKTVDVTVNSSPTFTWNTTDPSCGSNDGEIIINPDAGFTITNYSIDGGATTQSNPTFSGLAAGSYNVVIESSDGCEGTVTISLNNLAAPTVDNFNTTDPTCDNNDGTIEAVVSGGVPPYTYTWVDENNNTVGNSSTINGLGEGDYTVEVIDDNGCTVASDVTLTSSGTVDDPSFALQDFCEGETNSANITGTQGGTFTIVSPTGDGATIDATTGEITDGVGGTTYTVEYTTNGNCPDSETQDVTINTSPTVDGGQDITICDGESVTLTASTTGGTIYWDNGITDGVAFNPSSTDVYTVVAEYNGCTTSDEVVVSVNPLPTVSAGQDETTCVNYDIMSLSGSPSGGVFTGTGISGNNFDPSTAGVGTHAITYTYTDANGCENSATVEITVDGCLGLANNDLNTITIAPNPASKFVQVNVGENNSIETLKVLSLEGKTVNVGTTKVDSHTTKINVSSVAKGTYFIHLSTENGKIVKKVVVQ